MPVVSKYSNERVETLINEVVEVLQREQTPLDLALMVLGNATTELINGSVKPEQRAAVADKFAKALTASVK
ncbi:DUF1414 domain-containing protein [Motilimonas eburnea]|uniref:DUF1414 domain-containing protein n=1 Tax=Motilimonas eburnea TaxID=1737488 RepID=UPI001E4F5474|nr:DUF1414 domain-containing protein [Motilimonas eburnea]MCE2572476.1 DUF1414 domain-containing protein [Motilimonas eburnea]